MSEKDILAEAKERYAIASDGWRDIYDQLTEDMQFTYDVGDGQWTDEVRKQRGNRPCITVNKVQKFVRQMRGDCMQNRPRIKVIPVDSVADPRMAELYNGLIRQIEYLSTASVAYDTAYMQAVSGSVGYFRLVTQYTDDNSFDQDILIKRIINPISVHLDPTAVEFTLEDAQYGFIEELVPIKQFEKLYPKAEKVNFEGEDKNLFGDWLDNENVRVAEYFYKEPVEKKILLLKDGSVVDYDKKIDRELISKDRIVKTHKVKWVKMNGVEILEENEWAGKYIPIIPVFGDEVIANGKRYYLSLIRGAKGPQQMYNYWATAATENVALTPKSPFIVDHRQVKGFETEWEEANIKNRMYIRYNAVAGLQKPSREPQAQVPAAIINMMQTTAYDIEDHLGRYEASLGKASNERSGKAINARIAQADKGTYTYVDNLARAIVYAGKQLIDLIPKIYDTQRAIQIMDEKGENQMVNINTPAIDQFGNPGLINDLSVGKFDLIATTAATSVSQREEMVSSMIDACQYAPLLAPVITPFIFKYSDWPGASEVYQALMSEVKRQQEAEAMANGMPPMNSSEDLQSTQQDMAMRSMVRPITGVRQ